MRLTYAVLISVIYRELELNSRIRPRKRLERAKGIRLEYIQPGKPQQNAYVERFNRTVRYKWLSQYHWHNLDEVRDYATQ